MPTSPFLAPERDQAFKAGRWKGGGVNFYTVPGVMLTATGTTNGVVGEVRYWPFFAFAPILIDQLAAEVTTLSASTNFRMGFYPADSDWQPVGGPLADSGNISSGSTGVKTYTPGTPILAPRGRYLSGFMADSAVPAFRKGVGTNVRGPLVNSSLGSSLLALNVVGTQTFGAFPTPGTAWDTVTQSSSSFEHIVFYRMLAA